VCLFKKYLNLILWHSVDGIGAEFLKADRAPDDTVNSLKYFEQSVDNKRTLKPLTGTCFI
jgi:hypothetical protein